MLLSVFIVAAILIVANNKNYNIPTNRENGMDIRVRRNTPLDTQYFKPTANQVNTAYHNYANPYNQNSLQNPPAQENNVSGNEKTPHQKTDENYLIYEKSSNTLRKSKNLNMGRLLKRSTSYTNQHYELAPYNSQYTYNNLYNVSNAYNNVQNNSDNTQYYRNQRYSTPYYTTERSYNYNYQQNSNNNGYVWNGLNQSTYRPRSQGYNPYRYNNTYTQNYVYNSDNQQWYRSNNNNTLSRYTSSQTNWPYGINHTQTQGLNNYPQNYNSNYNMYAHNATVTNQGKDYISNHYNYGIKNYTYIPGNIYNTTNNGGYNPSMPHMDFSGYNNASRYDVTDSSTLPNHIDTAYLKKNSSDSIDNIEETANTTEVILGSYIMSSVRCPTFFKRIGFLCVKPKN